MFVFFIVFPCQFAGLGLEGRDHIGQRGGGRGSGSRGGGRYVPPHLRNRLEDAPPPGEMCTWWETERECTCLVHVN